MLLILKELRSGNLAGFLLRLYGSGGRRATRET
jgi:hypothetical protein